MAKKRNLEIKELMYAVDKKNKSWYKNLSKEKLKEYNPYMTMRYASSVANKNTAADYIYYINELVNQNFTDSYKHPELQWLLISMCGQGKVEFHPYIPVPATTKTRSKLYSFLAEVYPHFKDEEIQIMININSEKELKQHALDLGYDDKSIKDIFG